MTEVVEDLAAWLTAIWDEEERLARAADNGYPGQSWQFDGTAVAGPKVIVGPDEDDIWMREVSYAVWNCDDELDGCPDSAREWSAEGRHIARHDPASVLARIAANRKILALAMKTTADAPPRGYDWDSEYAVARASAFEDVLFLKAEQYADREGFRPEWAVERQGVEW